MSSNEKFRGTAEGAKHGTMSELLHPRRKELRNQKEVLLEVLEEFANLMVSEENLAAFNNAHPDFFPPKLYTMQRSPLGFPGEGAVVEGDDVEELRRLEKTLPPKPLLSFYHQLLRNAWATGFQEDDTLTLLGMPRDSESYFYRLPLGTLQFSRNGFHYQPTYGFARAVLMMSRFNWKAKVCLDCRKYFVGTKSPYCSDDCRQEGRRETKRQSWHEHKNEWRPASGRKAAGKRKISGLKTKRHKGVVDK
jgi:hypothetical protein